MKLLFYIWYLVVAVICNTASVSLVAQSNSSYILISHKVGSEIDAQEKAKFHLFSQYSDDQFKSAWFIEKSIDSVYQYISLLNDDIQKTAISKHQFDGIKRIINRKSFDYSKVDTAFIYAVELTDKSLLFGEIIDISEDSVSLKMKNRGSFSISKYRIYDVEKKMPVSEFHSDAWFDNPHASRHFFAPTAISLKAGEGYFQDVYLFLGFVNYGITDNILIGGGSSIIPGVGLDNQVFFFNPKVGFPVNEKIHLGGGVFYASFPFDDDVREHAGIIYSVGTYGTTDNNVTVGLGYSLFNGVVDNTPMAMLGGMYRLSRRTALVTENWLMLVDYRKEEEMVRYYWDEHTQTAYKDYYATYTDKYNAPMVITSYGIRFFSEKLCVDMAFFNIVGGMGPEKFFVPGIPYVDFVVKL